MVAEWSSASDELTIWAATQAPHEVRLFCSRLLALPEHRVRVIMRDTGGGFGQKVVPQREDMCIMLAARKVTAALQWIDDRRENIMSAGKDRHSPGLARMAFSHKVPMTHAPPYSPKAVGSHTPPTPLPTAL